MARVLLLISVLTILFSLPVSGEVFPVADKKSQLCEISNNIRESRPDAGGPSTRVAVGFRLFDIVSIDDVKETVTLDIGVRQRWTDHRLATLEGCNLELQAVWNPELVLINSGVVSRYFPEQVKIGPGGTVTYVQRYRGSFAFRHSLKRFPFDQHVLKISIVPLESSEDDVKLVVDEKTTGRAEVEFTVSNWTIGMAKAQTDTLPIELLEQTHSRYTFEIDVKRQPQYYVSQIIFPLILIIVMSWIVFWINPVHFGPQIGMSATAMLTLIAFHFAMRSMLPPVNYPTIMDQFIMWSTILVFLALIESVATTWLIAHKKSEKALRLDQICRWFFPIALVILTTVIFNRNNH